jgi:hypothetical protein
VLSHEEGHLAKQLIGGGNEPLGGLNSLLCFIRSSCVARQARVFEFIAAAAQVRKRPEALAKLGSYRSLDA